MSNDVMIPITPTSNKGFLPSWSIFQIAINVNNTFYGIIEKTNNINLDFPSLEAVNGFLANPELKADMEKGGVIGKPDVKILNRV